MRDDGCVMIGAAASMIGELRKLGGGGQNTDGGTVQNTDQTKGQNTGQNTGGGDAIDGM